QLAQEQATNMPGEGDLGPERAGSRGFVAGAGHANAPQFPAVVLATRLRQSFAGLASRAAEASAKAASRDPCRGSYRLGSSGGPSSRRCTPVVMGPGSRSLSSLVQDGGGGTRG